MKICQIISDTDRKTSDLREHLSDIEKEWFEERKLKFNSNILIHTYILLAHHVVEVSSNFKARKSSTEYLQNKIMSYLFQFANYPCYNLKCREWVTEGDEINYKYTHTILQQLISGRIPGSSRQTWVSIPCNLSP